MLSLLSTHVTDVVGCCERSPVAVWQGLVTSRASALNKFATPNIRQADHSASCHSKYHGGSSSRDST
jgi:hypothetical protein